MKPTPDPLTLGDIAQYCHVNRVTVQRWVKLSLLASYRTPGGHYRVTKEEFRRFLQKNNMPVYPEFFQDVPRRILIAENALQDAETMTASLTSAGYEVQLCSTARQALLAVGRFQPDLLVLNVEIEDLGWPGICAEVRALFIENAPRILVFLANPPSSPEEPLQAGADRFLEKPLNLAAFLHAVRDLMQPTLAPASVS